MAQLILDQASHFVVSGEKKKKKQLQGNWE